VYHRLGVAAEHDPLRCRILVDAADHDLDHLGRTADQISRENKGFGGGSEAAYAAGPPAVAAPDLRRNRRHARRITLTAGDVMTLVRG